MRKDGRTDGQTGRHDEANGRFSQFCEHSQNQIMKYRNMDINVFFGVACESDSSLSLKLRKVYSLDIHANQLSRLCF